MYVFIYAYIYIYRYRYRYRYNQNIGGRVARDLPAILPLNWLVWIPVQAITFSVNPNLICNQLQFINLVSIKITTSLL